MIFEHCKKKLKQSNQPIEGVPENEGENHCSEQSVQQETDTVNLYQKTDFKSAEMSRTLMIYIGDAIDKWAEQYDMQKLPRNIVYKKVLTLMNAWDETENLKK